MIIKPSFKIPSKSVVCLVCNAVLCKSEQGVRMHLQKHVNHNELKKEERLALEMKILGKTLRGEK